MIVRAKRLMRNPGVRFSCLLSTSLLDRAGFFWMRIVSCFRTPHPTHRSDRAKWNVEENDNRQIHSVGHWPTPCSLSNLLYSDPPTTTSLPTPLSTLPPLRWTARRGPWPTGDPDLQHYVGELLYKGTAAGTTLSYGG